MERKDELWVSKDGTVVAVGDMHEEHARNTLRMLIKQIREGCLTNLGYHQERLTIALAVAEAEPEIVNDGRWIGYEH